MKTALTNKQQLIYDFLSRQIRTKGYPPSIREICAEIGLSSTSTVHAHLEALEKRGYIRRSPSKNRSIELLKEEKESTLEFEEVPILGRVTAGLPILAEENLDGTFPIPLEYIKGDTVFMLRIVGDSMIGAGIFDRDLVLVRKQQTADNGDIVVALLDDSATVKRFYKELSHVRLQPENPSYSPIITMNVSILGKVIGLFRKF